MAAPISYRITIEPVSPGTTVGVDTIVRGATKTLGAHQATVIAPSDAQMTGVLGYLALIKGGATTTSVESAITALTP